jgi:hypothetical protein
MMIMKENKLKINFIYKSVDIYILFFLNWL